MGNALILIKTNFNLFKYFKNQKWVELFHKKSTNEMYNVFLEKFQHSCELFIPKKTETYFKPKECTKYRQKEKETLAPKHGKWQNMATE